MKNHYNSLNFNRLLLFFAIAFIYVVTARLGLLLALQPGFATAFWPPSGIAVAALLLFGNELWPSILLGSFVANMLTSVQSIATSIIVSSVIAVASTLQTVAICYLLITLTNSVPHLLNTRRNIHCFLLFTILCCVISPTLGLTTLYLTDVVPFKEVGSNWLTWWLGDTTGIYVFAPFIFALSKPINFSRFRYWEGLVLLALTLTISIFCFGGWVPKGYPIEYMLMPCLIWAVFRFTSIVPITIMVLIAIITVLGTVHGNGPFVQSSLNESLLLLQAFIAIMTATTLILVSAMNEIWHTHEVLEEFSQELKAQVKNRTIALKVQTEKFEETKITIQDATQQLKAQLTLLEEQSKVLLEENRQLKDKLEKE